ncbi:MAG: hypothetical protein EPN93_11625 [Spirochaetes bacterium]|nr:MAG: hypothetical protein EPN93_11625 [Spirochaetota bacterium]
MKRIATGLLLLFCFLYSDAPAATPDTGLHGTWEYREGFHESWLSGRDGAGWEATPVPRTFLPSGGPSDKGASFTLRARLSRESARALASGQGLAFESGILTAHRVEFYFNGRLFGAVGSLEPFRPAMGREFIGPLPCRDMNLKEENFIHMVFRVRGGDRVEHGLYETPRVTTVAAALARAQEEQYPGLVLAAVILTVGLLFLLLWMRNPAELYNLYFGLFSVSYALFVTTNLPCKEFMFGDGVLLRMRIDHVTLKTTIAAFALFVTHRFRGRHTAFALVLAAYCLALAGLDVFKGFEYTIFDRYKFWYPALFAGFPYLLYILVGRSRGGDRDAMVLLACTALFAASSAWDILVDARVVGGPLLIHSVTALIFLSMVVLLVNRYAKLRAEARSLNVDLEKRVRERSEELREANERLYFMARKERFMNAFNLTGRERELLGLMMEGLSGPDLAARLGISHRTVNNHVYNIYRKTGVHSHMEIFARFHNFE